MKAAQFWAALDCIATAVLELMHATQLIRLFNVIEQPAGTLQL
jgi:hypothetical protein